MSRIERGEVVPDALVFRNLARAFGMTTDEFHDKMDAAVKKAEEMARAGSSKVKKEKKDNWWGAAVAVIGTVGLVALIAAAVAALLGEEE